MKTVLLLVCSNIFMTVAWYGHLKYRKAPLLTVIVVSWLIAFAEYCCQVRASRFGYGEFIETGRGAEGMHRWWYSGSNKSLDRGRKKEVDCRW